MLGGLAVKRIEKKRGRGLSPTISTVILTSMILVIVISTSYIAHNVLTNQVEDAEFDVAKDVMLALNQMVKEVLFKPQSSRYVKTGFRTTMPSLLNTEERISVWTQVDTEPKEYLIHNCPISLLKIQAGTSITDLSQDVVGTSAVLLTDFTSLGHLYIQRSDRVELLLDFARIRCIHTGSLNLTQEYNVLEVVFVNMTTGSIQFDDMAVFVVRNLGATMSQHFYEGSLTLGVNDTRGYNDAILYSDLPHTSTLINLMVIDIEISVIGGV